MALPACAFCFSLPLLCLYYIPIYFCGGLCYLLLAVIFISYLPFLHILYNHVLCIFLLKFNLCTMHVFAAAYVLAAVHMVHGIHMYICAHVQRIDFLI